MRALRLPLFAVGLAFLLGATPASTCPSNYVMGAIRTPGGEWPLRVYATLYWNGQFLYSGEGHGCGFTYDGSQGVYGLNFLPDAPGVYDISIVSDRGEGFTSCFYDGRNFTVCNIELCEYCG